MVGEGTMSALANPDAITRSEFAQMASRLDALEANSPRASAQVDAEDSAASRRSEEVVTQNEFRLFKWLGTFAVATVLGALGVLYQQIADIRVEMRDLHTITLREIHTQIGGLREDIDTQIAGVRQEIDTQIAGVREEIATQITGVREGIGTQIGGLRQEIGGLRQEIGGLRQEFGAQIGGVREEVASLREDVASVRERVVRVETLLVEERTRTGD